MNAERKARVSELAKQLKAMTESQKIDFISKYGSIVTVEGHSLSRNNTCLLLLQRNGIIPTVVGGYRQWQKAGRQVQKGEHGSIIWFPRIQGQTEEDPGEVEGFMLGTVFDISQTKETEV
jgi:hypothetical protein